MLLFSLSGCGGRGVPVPPESGAGEYSSLARQVFRETNRLRADPSAYRATLEGVLARLSGNIYYPPGSKVGVRMKEGAPAIREAIAAIEGQRPRGRLQWSEPLARLAREHVLDTGFKGLVSHSSSSGKGLGERLSAVMASEGFTSVAENIAYGYDDGRDVVAHLLIDDGVPGRGHRKNLLKPRLSHTGVACGEHKRYRHMCVAIYAYRPE